MTIKNETRASWLIPLVVSTGLIALAALGFKTPSSSISAVEERVSKIEPVVFQNTTDIAVVKSRMDDFTDGMNRLLDAQGLQKIPKRNK